MYLYREAPININTYVNVYFFKDIFTTTAAESKTKKYESCNVNCCNICPTFESVSGRNIIQPSLIW